jgi:SAM-dependent methyltransferase
MAGRATLDSAAHWSNSDRRTRILPPIAFRYARDVLSREALITALVDNAEIAIALSLICYLTDARGDNDIAMHTAEMTAPTLDFKIAFLGQLLREFGDHTLRVLDMGCGTAKDWPSILREHPAVSYTGVEPDARSRTTANELLRGLPAKVLAGWGEATDMGDGFDLTLSLSVLEHVKYLDPFLRASVAATRPGGTIVHRYDLGHSLYPANHYERALVTLSRRAPWVVPAISVHDPY